MRPAIHQIRANVSDCGLFAFALTLLTLLLAPSLARAAAGDLDRSFSGNGKVRTDLATHTCGSGDYSCDDYARSVAIDSQGRIVAAGFGGTENGDFAVARYKPNGDLDRSFSRNGKVRTDVGGDDYAYAMTIDFQDRIVVAGYSSRLTNPVSVLVRYNPDGSLDRSFGGDGKVTTSSMGVASVAIDSEGGIIAAGGSGGDFALARYDPNGSLDRSFGDDGKVTTDFGDDHYGSARSVAIDSEERIVAVGERGDVDGLQTGDFALARYDPNGSLDRSFSGDGKVITDVTRYAYAYSGAIDSRDRIIAAGYLYTRAHGDQFALARYKPDGSLDRSFSGNGKVRTRLGDGRAVAIDSRGRIVVAGGGFALARYKPDGSLDRSFSGNGKVRTDFGSGTYSVAIDSRDRIVAAGNALGHRSDFALARYIGYRRR